MNKRYAPSIVVVVITLIAILVALIPDPAKAQGDSAGARLYVVAANFFTVRDSVTWHELVARWSGADPLPLGMGQPTYDQLSDQLKDKLGSLGANTKIVPADALVQWAWDHPDGWVIVPFDELSPRLKVMQIDDWNIFHLTTNADPYPLAFAPESPGSSDKSADQPANYDPAQLTTVAMTGVTAMTRATAAQLDAHGAAWATADIVPVLANVDFVHISNEVSFSEDCPRSGKILLLGDFCSKDSYLDVLKRMRVNVVELTGNHNNDYGYAAALRTLDIYRQNGMATFGGGANLDAAEKPLVVKNHGNTVMFVGCNTAGPDYAWATATNPGAARCDAKWLDPLLSGSATGANSANAVKIMDVQYAEYDQAWPLPQHRIDFARLAEAGADVVIGTQAHLPQTFTFIGNKFVHYGLGNFLFDQKPTRQRQFFIDKLIIYRGRLISIELLTGIIEDQARPRLMSPAERKRFLEEIFYVSQITNLQNKDSE